MRIDGCVALVTGANRGLGAVFTRTLLAHGARRVYAAARDPSAITETGAQPIRLDITDPDQVAAAAERCPDVTLLINNAGVLTDSPLLAAPTMQAARTEMEVNYFGTLSMCRTFAPVLNHNGGGAIVNILSAASFFTNPAMGSYAASKSAAWSLTNGIRIELHHQGTQVLAVHTGYIDTDMAKHVKATKTTPEAVASMTLAALEAGSQELLADPRTQEIKSAIPTDLTTLYPTIQATWDHRTPTDPHP